MLGNQWEWAFENGFIGIAGRGDTVCMLWNDALNLETFFPPELLVRFAAT